MINEEFLKEAKESTEEIINKIKELGIKENSNSKRIFLAIYLFNKMLQKEKEIKIEKESLY